MKYIRNPFSRIWSTLASLPRLVYIFEEEIENKIESPEEANDIPLDKESKENEYIHITDWVEPSVYFTIFCPDRRRDK